MYISPQCPFAIHFTPGSQLELRALRSIKPNEVILAEQAFVSVNIQDELPMFSA